MFLIKHMMPEKVSSAANYMPENREEHSQLAIHTAAFVNALVLLAAGLALCYGESINLT